MKKNLMQADVNQLSFFDVIDNPLKMPTTALCMLTDKLYRVHELEPWMARIVPSGEFYVLCAGHPLVLCETKEKVEPEMLYRHYRIGGKIYAAVGVGKDGECVEDEDDEDKELSDSSNPVLYEITDTGAKLIRSLVRNENNSFQGLEYSFKTEVNRQEIAKEAESMNFLDYWNRKAEELGVNVLAYNDLNSREARSFMKVGKFPYVNDMTSRFASYFTENAFSSVYVLDFEKNF